MLYSIRLTFNNKPAGTHGLTLIPAYFDIVCARTIRTKSQKNLFIRICGRWNALITLRKLCACAQTRFRCMNNFIFLCTNKLEYVNYRPEKGDVRINRVYELLEILWYCFASAPASSETCRLNCHYHLPNNATPTFNECV